MTASIGTPQWMAPEVLDSLEYTDKADVFSYGVIVWELVTHQRPHAGMDPVALVMKMASQNNGVPLDIPVYDPTVFFHPGVRQLLVECLGRDPTLRPSFADILVFLERVIRDIDRVSFFFFSFLTIYFLICRNISHSSLSLSIYIIH